MKKKWTKKKCLDDAKNYSGRTEWFNKSPTAYLTAKRYGWFEDCVKRMVLKINIWDKKTILADARKYKSLSAWRTLSPYVYNKAKHSDYFTECIAHMKTKLKIYTKKECLTIAQQFKAPSYWEIYSASSYRQAKENGWLRECIAHMRVSSKWTKDKCLNSTKKYKFITDWLDNEKGAPSFARRNNMMVDIKKLFGDKKENVNRGKLKKREQERLKQEKKRLLRTKEATIISASKFSTLKEWRTKDAAGYTRSLNKGWHQEIVRCFFSKIN